MRKVYEDQDMTMLGYYQTLLEDEGIETTVKNEYAQLATGEIPFTQVYPELWVIDDEKYNQAIALISVVRESAAENQSEERVRYKDSQMMRSVIRIGIMCLWIFLALVVYSFLSERNQMLDSIIK